MEEWKSICGFTDYEISNVGRVKSLKHGKERILKDRPDGSGYFQVVLCIDGKEISHKVHRLVATAFIPNLTPEETPIIDHIDRVRTHNNVSNLRWVNKSQNLLNSDRHDAETYGITVHERRKKKFKVQLNVSKVMTYLGCFYTIEEAKAVRDNFLIVCGSSKTETPK